MPLRCTPCACSLQPCPHPRLTRARRQRSCAACSRHSARRCVSLLRMAPKVLIARSSGSLAPRRSCQGRRPPHPPRLPPRLPPCPPSRSPRAPPPTRLRKSVCSVAPEALTPPSARSSTVLQRSSRRTTPRAALFYSSASTSSSRHSATPSAPTPLSSTRRSARGSRRFRRRRPSARPTPLRRATAYSSCSARGLSEALTPL